MIGVYIYNDAIIDKKKWKYLLVLLTFEACFAGAFGKYVCKFFIALQGKIVHTLKQITLD